MNNIIIHNPSAFIQVGSVTCPFTGQVISLVGNTSVSEENLLDYFNNGHISGVQQHQDMRMIIENLKKILLNLGCMNIELIQPTELQFSFYRSYDYSNNNFIMPTYIRLINNEKLLLSERSIINNNHSHYMKVNIRLADTKVFKAKSAPIVMLQTKTHPIWAQRTDIHNAEMVYTWLLKFDNINECNFFIRYFGLLIRDLCN